MKTVTAVIRTESLEAIVKSLGERGVRGMTIAEIKGLGREVQLYQPYSVHNRIEIIVPDEKVEEVTAVILQHGKTGFAGDGLIGVYPMDYMIKIRTGEKKT